MSISMVMLSGETYPPLAQTWSMARSLSSRVRRLPVIVNAVAI